ncbi:MAG: glycosyltransferase family 61 protein [Cyclobacteriaceae bacterium]
MRKIVQIASKPIKELLLSVRYYKWRKRLRQGRKILDRQGLIKRNESALINYGQDEVVTCNSKCIHFQSEVPGVKSPSFLEFLNAEFTIPKPATLTLENAELVGQMAVAVDCQDEIILESTYNSMFYLNKTGDAKYLMNKDNLPVERYYVEAISLVDLLDSSYFFWFTSFLPLLEPIYDQLKVKENFKILLNKNAKRFQVESLQLMGLEENIEFWDAIRVKVDKLHLPINRNLFIWENDKNLVQILSPQAINWIRKCLLLDDKKEDTPKRFFISRRQAHGRHIVNENELNEIFIKYDITSVCLEDISLRDQINMFGNAKLIIAPHGAGLTNVMFTTKASIIEFFPSGWTYNRSIIYQLANLLGHTYSFNVIESVNSELDMHLDKQTLEKLIESHLPD